jgi:hypothetical protein
MIQQPINLNTLQVEQPINLNNSQIGQPIKPPPLNSNQLSKLNKLEQVNSMPITEQVYNLEYIFNKIKEIGRIIQTIRIERRGIIYGTELWEMLSNILGKEEINSDLVAEVKNYEFNVKVMDIAEKRINAIQNFNPEAYPDYFLNNIVKLYYQNNSTELNMVSLMHMGLDIGQLEYLIYKYITKPILPCYMPKKYDDQLFYKILLLIQTIGRTLKNVFINNLPEDKILLPQLLVKYIQNLFEEHGNEIINQMSKFKIDRDKIKLFFEATMDDDLHNADDFNIQSEDTMGERAYKVTYKYLRDDFNNKLDEYLLRSSYKILFIMLDLYDYDKPNLPIDKLIELMFCSGEFLASITISKDLKTTTFLENMKSFDDMSINKLFNISSYFKNNNLIPNKQISDLLDKVIKKLKTMHFSISTENILIIPEHISYLPVEITQLYCIIKPKQTTNVEMLMNKLNEINLQLLNPASLEELFKKLKDTVKLDDVPVITSILTPENDLDILGIDENEEDETPAETGEIAQESGEMSPESGELPQSQEISEGKYLLKYLKYKEKYIKLKNQSK